MPSAYKLNNVCNAANGTDKKPDSADCGGAQKSITTILYHNILCFSTLNFNILIPKQIFGLRSM